VAHPDIPPDDFFDIPQGLREGSKLSPLLFNLAVNDMEAELLKQQPGSPSAQGIFVPASGWAKKQLGQKRLHASVWQRERIIFITHCKNNEPS
jgi:hypothetical protein